MSTSSVRTSSTPVCPSLPPRPSPRGRVIFVGTGPGDPDLLTLGAIAALADASAVILDDERQREILQPSRRSRWPTDAEVTTLGLTEAGKPLTPSARAKIVLKHATAGARVVRLVTGDPFLDNARGRRGRRLRPRRASTSRSCPGVSSLTAVPEYAGDRPDPRRRGAVRLGHRRPVHQGQRPRSGARPPPWWSAPGSPWSPAWSRRRMAAGRPETTTVLVTLHGGSTEQITLPTTLDELVDGGEGGPGAAAPTRCT